MPGEGADLGAHLLDGVADLDLIGTPDEVCAGRGEIRAGRDAEVVEGLLLGTIFYRRLLSRQPVTPEFVERVVDTFLSALNP